MLQHLKQYSAIYICLILAVVLFSKSSHYEDLQNGKLSAIRSDGAGYYAYLPALFIYRDLDFHFTERPEIMERYSHFPVEGIVRTPEGERYTKYYVGTAILMAPFFLLGTIVAALTDYPLDGYSLPFELACLLAALSYMLAGLIVLRSLLKNIGFNSISTFFTVLSIGLGSNLLIYSYYVYTFSHVYAFFVCALFLWAATQYLSKPTFGRFAITAAVWVLLGLTRPTTGLLILLALPLLPFKAQQWRRGYQFIISDFKKLLTSILPAILVGSTQLILYKIQVGDWLMWSYSDEGFDFSNPHFYQFLFGYRKGLFVYSPIFFFALLGMVLWFRSDPFRSLVTLLFIAVVTFVLSSWWNWWYGGGLGSRSFIDFYPALAIPMAVSIQQIQSWKWLRWIILPFGLFLIFVGLAVQLQFSQNIIHYDNMDKDKYWQVFLRTERVFRWNTTDTPTFLSNVSTTQVGEFTCANNANCDGGFAQNPVFKVESYPDRGVYFEMPEESKLIAGTEYVVTVDANMQIELKNCWARIICSFDGDDQSWQSRPVIQEIRQEKVWTNTHFEFLVKPKSDQGPFRLYVGDNRKVPVDIANITIGFHKIEIVD